MRSRQALLDFNFRYWLLVYLLDRVSKPLFLFVSHLSLKEFLSFPTVLARTSLQQGHLYCLLKNLARPGPAGLSLFQT